MGRNSEISGNPVNEPVMGTSVQVTNGTPGDAPEWGLTRFAASTAVLNSGSCDESATAKRLTGGCGSPEVSALVSFFSATVNRSARSSVATCPIIFETAPGRNNSFTDDPAWRGHAKQKSIRYVR